MNRLNQCLTDANNAGNVHEMMSKKASNIFTFFFTTFYNIALQSGNIAVYFKNALETNDIT